MPTGTTCSGACSSFPLWLALFAVYGLYNRDIKRISHSTVDDIPWILHAVLVGCLLTWLYFNLLHIPKLVFFDVLLLGGIGTLALLLLRSLTRGLAIRALGPERVLFIGDHPMEFLMNKMAAHPEYGLKPVGVVSASSTAWTRRSTCSRPTGSCSASPISRSTSCWP